MSWLSDYSWYSRDGSPPSWRVEFGLLEREYPTYDDYIRSWGDEPRWTSMLVYGWSTCTKPYLAPKIDIDVDEHGRIEGTDQNIGVFTMALHLLALGVGWTDITAGLRNWRVRGYQSSQHVVLDYVMNALGPDALEALEIFCGANPYSELSYALDYLANYPQRPGLAGVDAQLTAMYEDLERSRYREGKLVLPWDSLHLTGHVANSLAGGGGGVEPPGFEFEEISGRTSKQWLSVDAYRTWAFALPDLEYDLRVSDDPVSTDDVEVDVQVRPIGYLGTFLKAHDTNRWFMTTRDVPLGAQFTVHRWGQPEHLDRAKRGNDADPASSPLFGFDLTPEMSQALAPLLAHFDAWEDEPIERIEVLCKEEVDRCHFLVYWIGGEANPDERAWTRVNGTWVEGMYAPDGNHYMSCLAEMLSGAHLPIDEPPLDLMLEDSPILEAQSWAGGLLVEVWDSLEKVPSIVGRLGTMDQDALVEGALLNDEDLASLKQVLQEKWSLIHSSDERQGLQALEEVTTGGRANARQLLESVAFRY